MTAIDRTAYPRLGTRLTRKELDERYVLTNSDLDFIQVTARSEPGRLLLAVLLKARRDLGCFPASDEVNAGTVAPSSMRLASVWKPKRAPKPKLPTRLMRAGRLPMMPGKGVAVGRPCRRMARLYLSSKAT